jgi:CBS domain-containing protein
METFMKVKDVMTKTPFCCLKTDSIQEATKLMKTHDVGAIPVVSDCESHHLIGIVTDRDICLKIVEPGKAITSKVSEAMTKTVATSHADDTIESCEAQMELYQVRRIPVVDSKGNCVGIVSQADIAFHDSSEHTSRTVAAISRHRTKKHMAEHIAVGTA